MAKAARLLAVGPAIRASGTIDFSSKTERKTEWVSADPKVLQDLTNLHGLDPWS
jgi:hypothetical protein